jgi:hypothetical protein
MITLIVHILVVALVLGLLLWAAGMVPPLNPFMPAVRIVVIVLFVIWLIFELLPLAGIKF